MTGTPRSLYRYLILTFLAWFTRIIGGVTLIVVLFESVELLRRTATSEIFSANEILLMILLKSPIMILQLLPFIVLIATLVTFLILTRSHEIIVMRMSGLSLVQMILPVVSCVLLIKSLETTLIHPLAAWSYGKFEQMESKIQGQEHRISFSKNGLWVRQSSPTGSFILHAKSAHKGLIDVTVFSFDPQGRFYRRLDAHEAFFSPGRLILSNAHSVMANGTQKSFKTYAFLSDLSLQAIQDGQVPLKTLTLWNIQRTIGALEQAGLSTTKCQVHVHSLIAQICFVGSMVILGAVSVLRYAGRKSLLPLVLTGLFFGFISFFINDFILALGRSGILAPWLAAWSPVILCLFMGISILFHLEEG